MMSHLAAICIVVIAHRGASGYVPEHTLAGAALAHGLGADFIEPDVVLTKDDVPIVLHDVHLEATTDASTVFPDRKRADGRWYAIDFSLAEIKTLHVRERIPNRFPTEWTPFTVPTLEEEIQLLQGLNKSRGRNVGIYPELKAPAFHRKEGKDITKATLSILAKYGYDSKTSQVYLQSFDPVELKRIRNELKSPLKLVQLISSDAPASETGVAEIATYADGIGPPVSQVLAVDPRTKELRATSLVGWAHARRLVVHPYTLRADALPPGVPSFEALLRLLFDVAKVDGAFTDFPDLVVAYRKR